MSCVDKFDQIKKTYEIDKKVTNGGKEFFFYFLDASVVNAYIAYKQTNKSTKCYT